MENVLFGHGDTYSPGAIYDRSKCSTETDYLQELERINNELKGFVPIGASGGSDRDVATAVSLISTEATDSGVDPSLMAERGSDEVDTVSMDTTNNDGYIARSRDGHVFPNGEFY